jgi:integrase
MRRAPLKAVQELLGHSTIEMTMRYSHLSPDVRKDAVRLLDADSPDNRLTTASFSNLTS